VRSRDYAVFLNGLVEHVAASKEMHIGVLFASGCDTDFLDVHVAHTANVFTHCLLPRIASLALPFLFVCHNFVHMRDGSKSSSPSPMRGVRRHLTKHPWSFDVIAGSL
jgi:hypothetical protein